VKHGQAIMNTVQPARTTCTSPLTNAAVILLAHGQNLRTRGSMIRAFMPARAMVYSNQIESKVSRIIVSELRTETRSVAKQSDVPQKARGVEVKTICRGINKQTQCQVAG
jgi:hypothetical protein